MENKRANILLGLLIGILGVIAFSLGTYLMVKPGTTPEDEKRISARNAAICKKALKDVFGTYSGKITFTVMQPGLDDPEVKLLKASLAATACRGYEIKSFCIGQSCSLPGMEMQLGPKRR